MRQSVRWSLQICIFKTAQCELILGGSVDLAQHAQCQVQFRKALFKITKNWRWGEPPGSHVRRALCCGVWNLARATLLSRRNQSRQAAGVCAGATHTLNTHALLTIPLTPERC